LPAGPHQSNAGTALISRYFTITQSSQKLRPNGFSERNGRMRTSCAKRVVKKPKLIWIPNVLLQELMKWTIFSSDHSRSVYANATAAKTTHALRKSPEISQTTSPELLPIQAHSSKIMH